MTAQTQPESLAVADRLAHIADDPMWDAHAEISKSLCRVAAAELRRQHAEIGRLESLLWVMQEQELGYQGDLAEAREELAQRDMIQLSGNSGQLPARKDQSRADFKKWAEREYRNADEYSRRDFALGLSAWQAATNHKAADVVLPWPAATVYTMEALVPGGRVKHHAQMHLSPPAGTALYTEQQVRELLAAAPLVPQGWMAIESAPKGELVMVYTPPQPDDWPDAVRIDFDYIDTDADGHYWHNHGEHYEHFCCVAKPEGSTGPSEKAPYTHWMPLPQPPKEQT